MHKEHFLSKIMYKKATDSLRIINQHGEREKGNRQSRPRKKTRLGHEAYETYFSSILWIYDRFEL